MYMKCSFFSFAWGIIYKLYSVCVYEMEKNSVVKGGGGGGGGGEKRGQRERERESESERERERESTRFSQLSKPTC